MTPARSHRVVASHLGLALLSVLGTALFIAGDLLGPGALRPIGGGLALSGYGALVILRRPVRPRNEADAAEVDEARHVA